MGRALPDQLELQGPQLFSPLLLLPPLPGAGKLVLYSPEHLVAVGAGGGEW